MAKKVYQVGYAYPHMHLPASKVTALERRLQDLARETGDAICVHQPCAPDAHARHSHHVFIECTQNFADRVAALDFGARLPRTGLCLDVRGATVLTAPKPPAVPLKKRKFGF